MDFPLMPNWKQQCNRLVFPRMKPCCYPSSIKVEISVKSPTVTEILRHFTHRQYFPPPNNYIELLREALFVFFSRLHLENLWHRVPSYRESLGLRDNQPQTFWGILFPNLLFLLFNQVLFFFHLSSYQVSFRIH